MGVINLGLLVEKIKRKLEKSGFIKNTDYATASAAGVVKIGNNIDVTEAGVISVPAATQDTAGVVALSDIPTGGVTIDELWSGTTTTTYTSITASLTHPVSDYKALLVCEGATSITAGVISPLLTIGESTITYAFKNLTKEVSVAVSASDVQIKNAGSGSLSPVTLYGLK